MPPFMRLKRLSEDICSAMNVVFRLVMGHFLPFPDSTILVSSDIMTDNVFHIGHDTSFAYYLGYAAVMEPLVFFCGLKCSTAEAEI